MVKVPLAVDNKESNIQRSAQMTNEMFGWEVRCHLILKHAVSRWEVACVSIDHRLPMVCLMEHTPRFYFVMRHVWTRRKRNMRDNCTRRLQPQPCGPLRPCGGRYCHEWDRDC